MNRYNDKKIKKYRVRCNIRCAIINSPSINIYNIKGLNEINFTYLQMDML